MIEKPWGHEVIHHNERYVVKELFMKAGESCSLQYHDFKTETLIIVRGELRVEIGESAQSLDEMTLRSGDVLTLLPKTVHRMSAIEDALYFEASTVELDDVIRLEDRYGRT